MHRHTLRALALAATGLAASGAHAQDITLKPLIDARLRYEHVDQDGIADSADAVTLRIRSGIQASTGPFSALVEAEGNIPFTTSYNDGFNGRALPIVADPGNIELNRAQLSYADNGLKLTAGRQVLDFADQRFVGPAAWRQNEQTFDAVRVQYSGLGGLKGLTVDAAYSWSVRTVNGIQGTPARPQSIGGDNYFGVLGYATPIGTLSGFAYLVDQDSATLSGFRLSSQTYGVRFAGSRPLSKTIKLGYTASYARQSDYARNPNHYAANYWLGEAGLTGKVLSATAGYEVLGADKGVALTSVQTPLASFFKFQGWDSKFTVTPPNGLRDAYATLGANWKGKGWVSGYGLGATYHHFDSDRLSLHYGDEVDVIASAKVKRYAAAIRYAHYRADKFATDTDKVFVTLEWAY
jgi:hypothetical protein